jgi:hypothetical protein
VERALPEANSGSARTTARRPCPEASGPPETYAPRFDARFASLAQRRAFRAYLQGLLLARDRNQPLTASALQQNGT